MKNAIYAASIALILSSCASFKGANSQNVGAYDDVYYTPGDEIVNEAMVDNSNSNQLQVYDNQSKKVDAAYTKTDNYSSELEDVYDNNINDDGGLASDGLSYEDHFNRLNGDDEGFDEDAYYNDGYYDGYDDG
ncbi:MAG: hypothetical protein ACI8ZN_001578, partial [Bacteroidia bacterium]